MISPGGGDPRRWGTTTIAPGSLRCTVGEQR
jgi:hypothetical protein